MKMGFQTLLVISLIAVFSISFASAGVGDYIFSLFNKDLQFGSGDDIPVADTFRIIRSASLLKNLSCTDYDGGIYSTVGGGISLRTRQDILSGALKGDYTLSQKFYNDRCVKNRTKEYFCGVNGTMKFAYVNCTSGCDVNGISCKIPASQQTCVDSDGINFNVKGNVTVVPSSGISTRFDDYCSNPSVVV